MFIKKHIGAIWKYGINFFTKGHQRSLDAKKNIIGSLLIKGISIAIGLILVPLTINYVNPMQYGIWLTLSSMIAWISFFDIGFTNGLRNKFAEAKAKGDKEVAKIYISTTYFYIAIIFITLWIVFMLLNQFINWHKLLSLPEAMEQEVSKLAILIFSYFCFQFIFRVIGTILVADQQPAKASLLDMLGQLLSLAIIFTLTRLTNGSILYLGLAVGIAPTLILVVANIYLFNTKYKEYKPALKFVQKKYAKNLMKLGLKFFILQITTIIQYESSLFIIAHYFNATDPTAVTSYNIAYKYFFTLQMGFMILLSPLWSGVTDAYNSGDVVWIKNMVKKYLLLLIPFILVGIIMLVFADQVYELWLGKNVVHIEFNISLLFFIFFSTGMFASVFVAIINGMGALKIQFISSLISSAGFFCLALLLINHFHLGVQSVIISSIVANVFGYVIAPIQVYKMFYKKSASPIWYK
ncbi:lipopolysaccharide biosynthesis protein [Ferruginibacter sp.]|nr:MATE family efflux transporter [Ferruginibacter sp.]